MNDYNYLNAEHTGMKNMSENEEIVKCKMEENMHNKKRRKILTKESERINCANLWLDP